MGTTPNESPQWIASRALHGTHNEVVWVRIGTPERVSDREARCPYLVGPPDADMRCAHGYDEVQALINALVAVRVEIDRSGAELTWLGGMQGHGIPRLIPQAFGPTFTRELESIVDDRIRAHAAELKRQHRGKPTIP